MLPFEAAFEIVREFAIDGRLMGIEPHERGHIHNTFISTWQRDDQVVRFLHQQRVAVEVPGHHRSSSGGKRSPQRSRRRARWIPVVVTRT